MLMPTLKLLEDFIALARTGSFVRAAELRHVTHPAFGRRIRALEHWAGTALIQRAQVPVTLTTEGELLLKTACQVVHQLDHIHRQLNRPHPLEHAPLTIATGRTLARTLVTDWITQLRKGRKPALEHTTAVEITTGTTGELIALLSQGKVDFMCCYEHPALSVPLEADNYHYITMMTDTLVPVSRTQHRDQPKFSLHTSGHTVPLIHYAQSMSIARILNQRLENLPYALVPNMRCDSLDAAHSAVINGLGVAWLPWSLVMGDCRKKTLIPLGGRSDHISFEVRLYRKRTPLSPSAERVWQSAQHRP